MDGLVYGWMTWSCEAVGRLLGMQITDELIRFRIADLNLSDGCNKICKGREEAYVYYEFYGAASTHLNDILLQPPQNPRRPRQQQRQRLRKRRRSRGHTLMLRVRHARPFPSTARRSALSFRYLQHVLTAECRRSVCPGHRGTRASLSLTHRGWTSSGLLSGMWCCLPAWPVSHTNDDVLQPSEH
jgi:hypothetical protein